jgi:hypothetical protein
MNESSRCAERINSFITTACLLLGLASPLVNNHMIYRHSPNTGSTHNRPSLLQRQWTSHRRRPLERQPQTISSWLERVTCTAQAPNPGVPTQMVTPAPWNTYGIASKTRLQHLKPVGKDIRRLAICVCEKEIVLITNGMEFDPSTVFDRPQSLRQALGQRVTLHLQPRCL